MFSAGPKVYIGDPNDRILGIADNNFSLHPTFSNDWQRIGFFADVDYTFVHRAKVDLITELFFTYTNMDLLNTFQNFSIIGFLKLCKIGAGIGVRYIVFNDLWLTLSGGVGLENQKYSSVITSTLTGNQYFVYLRGGITVPIVFKNTPNQAKGK